MTDNANYSEPVSLFDAEIKQLNAVRNDIMKKIQAATGGQLPPSVASSAGLVFQHLDTGYLWLTQVEQFIRMNSADNVEAVAEDALAKGNVTVVDGGKQ